MARKSGKPPASSVGIETVGVNSDPFEKGTLFDERMIDRQQALVKYFTVHDGKESLRPSPERIYGTANSRFALLNPRSSFIAPQIRELYDPTRIQRMGVSIRDGVDGQLQNGGVSFLDDDHIEQYLHDMNHYFGTDIRLNDLTRHPKFGRYIITAYGHNRQFAIASANLETYGHPDRGVQFYVKVFDNPEFWRILGNQATENTGEPPPMWVRARQIVKYQEFRGRDGHNTPKEDVGRLFNVDKDQIWRAERYDALPDEIKELVMAERLPYSGAFELDQLNGYYEEKYIIELAHRLAANRASGPQILDAVRRRLAATVLTPEILHIIEKDQLTLIQAQELVRIAPFITEMSLNQLAGWICTAKPDIETIRKHVSEILNQKIHGVRLLFDDDMDWVDPEIVRMNMKKMRGDELRAGIQRALTEVTRHLDGLSALLTSGLAADVIDLKPMATSTPNYLQSIVTKLIESINDAELGDEGDAAITELQSLLNIEPASTQLAITIDQMLVRLRDLLALEQSESPESQIQRRKNLGAEIIAIVRPTQPLQEGLF